MAEFLPPGSWRYIDGKTGKEERRKHLADFKAGEYKFLLNLKCLTTGVDVPRIDAVAIFRGTSSVNTHKQMIGRGMPFAFDEAGPNTMEMMRAQFLAFT